METLKLKIKNRFNEDLVCEINKLETLGSMQRPSLLILHALTGNKENRTINFLAKNIPLEGFNTIQFDFSGHGKSQGMMGDSTVSKQLEEIKVILNQIKQVNTKQIILVGNSFSVITALAYGKIDARVVGLILLSGRANFLNYIDTFEKKDDKYKLSDNVLINDSFFEDYRKYNPLENINSFVHPVLIIHGEKDDIIPAEEANLFYSMSNSKEKEIYIVPNAGHRYSEQKEDVLNRVINFLKKNY